MPDKPEPKISTSEAVLVGMFLLILDAIDLIPVAGDLTDIAGAPLILYYYTKHINGIAYIAAEILDAIPVVQELPSRSIVWWGTVAFDRFAPAKVEEEVEKLGEEAEGKEGGGKLEGEEGINAEASGSGERGVESTEEAQRGGGETTEGETATTEQTPGQEEAGEPGTGGGEEGTETSENGEENPEEQGEGEEEDILGTESEENPVDVTEKKLFDGSEDDISSTKSDESEDEDEAEEATPNPRGNTIGIDSSRKWQENQRNAKPNQPTSVYDVRPRKKAA